MIVVRVLCLGVVPLLFWSVGCGCSNAASTTTLDAAQMAVDASGPDAVVSPTVIVGNPPTRVNVAIARTDAERTRGLMGVMNLPMDDGMIFLFPSDADHNFWMKNTLIPLDMIFIRADLTVAGVVANAVPMSLEPRGVGMLSRYVLEVNGGWAAAHGVTANSTVTFEGFTP